MKIFDVIIVIVIIMISVFLQNSIWYILFHIHFVHSYYKIIAISAISQLL